MDRCLWLQKILSCSFMANSYLCSVGRHNPDRFMRESYLRLSHKTGTKDLQKNVV